MTPLFLFDRQRLKAAGPHAWLIGVDEVGRGAFAGPVTATAVCLDKRFFDGDWHAPWCQWVDDSKKLKPTDREAIAAEMDKLKQKQELYVEIGTASVTEIETHNIVGATCLAMTRALEALEQNGPANFSLKRLSPMPLFELAKPSQAYTAHILIDGRPMKALPYAHEAVVRGDSQSLSIALASIYAKVHRDAYMASLDKHYPAYGFARHKGYGTAQHRRAILEYGQLPLHRRQFLKKL